MNERIERLVKIVRERDVGEWDDFIELRDRLEDLLDEEGKKELTTAWETMINDKGLDKWDEDFLKAIDGTYEGEPFGYTTKAQHKLQMERRQQEAYMQDLQKQQMLDLYKSAQQAQNSITAPSYASHQSASSGTGLLDKLSWR